MTAIFLLILLSSKSFCSDSSWALKRNLDGVKVYQFKDRSNVTASIQSLEKMNINFNDPNLISVIDKLKLQKQEALKYAGITNWVLSETKLDPKQQKIIFKGSYVDSSLTKIEFHEEHFYLKNKTTHVLLTWPYDFEQGRDVSKEFINTFDKEE